MYAADLTTVFDELLKKHGGRPTTGAKGVPDTTNGFLKEAYRINGHIATLSKQLGDIRPAYLSTARPRRTKPRRGDVGGTTTMTGLTDGQREEIDGNAKRLLRDLNASIRGLADAEALHQETQRALVRRRLGGGGMGMRLAGLALLPSHRSAEQAAAEEALGQVAAHRESILWLLRQRLQACGQAQQTMMEARVARMVVETTVAGYGVGGGGGMATATALEQDEKSHDSSPALDTEAGLTQEQLQMFEHDNQDMLKYYETTLDKVRAAEQSLVEISELQSMLVGNLELQSAHVDQMVADSVNTAQNVARGNQELKKALDRPSAARYTFYAASGLCLFVVVWDFFV